MCNIPNSIQDTFATIPSEAEIFTNLLAQLDIEFS